MLVWVRDYGGLVLGGSGRDGEKEQIEEAKLSDLDKRQHEYRFAGGYVHPG